jgi:ribosomal protection tetracycline resistance protein
MTASHYAPRQSHAHQKFNKAMSSVGADFRHLAPVVVTAALDQARTRVCEPVDRFELEFPERLVNPLSALLGRLGATTSESVTGNGWTRYRGHVRSAQVAELASRLPDLTGGEAILQTEFDHYAPVTESAPPARPRTGVDPRNRHEWFRAMPR